MKVYEKLAQLIIARNNCLSGRALPEWAIKHKECADAIVAEYMPSGSGFDSKPALDWQESNANRLIFNCSFHHMNEWGCYVGWSIHNVIVTPDLAFRFSVRVTGRDRNKIKDHIVSAYESALNADLPD